VVPGHLTPEQLLRKMTSGPAKIFPLLSQAEIGGTLELGKPADVTLIDPEAQWTVNVSEFSSKGKNNPFHGKTLTGKVVATFVGGRCVYGDAFIKRKK
jgi:dihydroorotase